MGCCNKQRAAGARIAGLPQPSLRQRLSVFFGERLDFSAGIWIIATNAAFHRGVCDSVGGCPRNRHWEMASIKISQNRYPAIPPTECKNHLWNPPCPQQHQEYACKLSTHALPTCYCFCRQAIKAPGIGNPVEAPLCSGCNFRRARPMPHPFPSRHIAHYAEGAVQL